MILFLDKDYKCHLSKAEEVVAQIETEAFEGKCAEFIEGCRFVPEGEVWTREDGQRFAGEMIAPWKDYAQLEQCQAIYERMLAQQADMRSEAEQLKAQNAEYEAAMTEIENALEVTTE